MSETHAVVVRGRTPLADDVVELELGRADGAPLPAFAPGAHLDLLLPGGPERQYSLSGEPGEPTWRIAVLRERAGRGGSMRVHDELPTGAELVVRGPNSHFAMADRVEGPALFVAAGIGITPLLPMLAEAAERGWDWRLLYAGRSRARMAYLRPLLERWPDRVAVFAADEGARLDLAAELAAAGPLATVHCCGPERLLDEADRLCGGWPEHRYHRERFTPPTPVEHAETPFEVELALTGVTLTVPAERSILDVAEEVGAFVLSSCREGTCGTCETPILEGRADHRDVVLSPQQQSEQRSLMICVSRAACPRLVLEL
jgi:ferredoxin-NADP reductase